MTADERIEKLLNRFGQTISDLPKPMLKKDSAQLAYDRCRRNRALQSAMKWFPVNVALSKNMCISACLDYICHLEALCLTIVINSLTISIQAIPQHSYKHIVITKFFFLQ